MGSGIINGFSVQCSCPQGFVTHISNVINLYLLLILPISRQFDSANKEYLLRSRQLILFKRYEYCGFYSCFGFSARILFQCFVDALVCVCVLRFHSRFFWWRILLDMLYASSHPVVEPNVTSNGDDKQLELASHFEHVLVCIINYIHSKYSYICIVLEWSDKGTLFLDEHIRRGAYTHKSKVISFNGMKHK